MRRIAKAFLSLLMIGVASTAQAQTYPDRPIRLIVSIAAGSVTDVIMRKAAAELQPRLGQPLIIENRGGASGIVAAQACAQAAPDGYTLCVIYHSTMSYNPLLFDKLPYDPDHDLVPVTRLFFLNEGLFVSSALGVKSVAELKSLAIAKPDSLNFATLGEGSFPDLFLRWLNNQWGTRIVGVPYKGGGPAAQALAANQVQLTRFGIGNFLGLIQAGNVVALAVSADKRSLLLPDVPTLAEAGLAGYPGQGWWGLAAPKGTPPAIVDKVNSEFVKLFSEPGFIEYLNQQAVVAAPTTPAAFAAFLKEDRSAAEALVKLANSKRETYKPD
ncbi:MAG TPA: tripartite tricarboxylate transporter substrate binding protein [Pseudolabrys sp.]|jgi:tripartite-type tricarboxylate transporter receptor subunit TctC|nr:tripartite tricarboxylate transporter substrate binding protein [Pseudolabrys sp.]